jgi:DNA-binding LacI/PurR family transcriptional regulator
VPELSTVEQPIAQIAETAVVTLQTLIETPARQLPNSYYRPVLRKRASTGPVRAALKVRGQAGAARVALD